MDMITLQCFLAVAELRSVTKAAERVGRTQSALSQQMAKLEATLGKSLFSRGRQFALTEEGDVFLNYARQILGLYREAMDRFQEPDLAGEIRFGLPEDFASVFLHDVLVEFIRIHPRITLSVECDLTVNLFERFEQKEFDLVLVKMNRPQDFPNGVDVWSEPLEWVGSTHFIDENKPIPLVLAPAPCVYRASALQALALAGKSWRLVFSSPSYAGTIAAIKAGMGVSVLPRTMIPSDLTALDAKILPPLQGTHVSLLKHESHNTIINSFEEFVLKKLRH